MLFSIKPYYNFKHEVRMGSEQSGKKLAKAPGLVRRSCYSPLLES
jgi:hypothetical protein